MTDLVERLRELADRADVIFDPSFSWPWRQAADEIERLRKENQELKLQYLSDQGQWIEETGRLREELHECARYLEEQVSASYWHIEQPFDANTQRRYDRDMARAHKAFAALREKE